MSFRQGARQFFERRGAPTPPRPYDAEVDYLESTGTQYIDTGDALDFRNSEIVFRAMQTANETSEQALLGSREHSKFELYTQNEKIRFWAGDGFWTPNTVPFPKNQVLYGNLVVTDSGVTLTVSGQTSTDTGTSSISGAENLQLFAYRSTYKFYGRLYFVKVYISNVLTFDFIPVRFTNDQNQSEGAMYDRVSEQVFRNAGTGAFTIGPDKS